MKLRKSFKEMKAAVGEGNLRGHLVISGFCPGQDRACTGIHRRRAEVCPTIFPPVCWPAPSTLEGDALQAQTHWAKFWRRHRTARAAFDGRRHLAARETDRAVEAFAAAVEGLWRRADILSLAGQVWRRGDFRVLPGYFAKAVALDPKDASARTRLGISRLASGDATRLLTIWKLQRKWIRIVSGRMLPWSCRTCAAGNRQGRRGA